MLTNRDKEKLYKLADRNTLDTPRTADIIVRFDRDIFYYNIDEVPRQKAAGIPEGTPYDIHAIIQTSIVMNKKKYAHEIAMDILSNMSPLFKNFRDKAFGGRGKFTTDFQFIVRNIASIVENNTDMKDIREKLQGFKELTLVQINYATGTVDKVKLPEGHKLTLNEWAKRYNAGAGSNNHYAVAGMKIGA